MIMIDKILLFPYWLTLKVRHFMYDHGMRKVHVPDVPTICVGNITVGGTGKTPHTEMLIRTLAQDVEAPVEQGQTLGQFEVRVGEELRCTIPIVSAQNADRLTLSGIFHQLLGRATMSR